MIVEGGKRQKADIGAGKCIDQRFTGHPLFACIRAEVGHDNNMPLLGLVIACFIDREIGQHRVEKLDNIVDLGRHHSVQL